VNCWLHSLTIYSLRESCPSSLDRSRGEPHIRSTRMWRKKLKSLTPMWIWTSVLRSSRCTDFLPEELSLTASCLLAVKFPVFSETKNVYLCLLDQKICPLNKIIYRDIHLRRPCPRLHSNWSTSLFLHSQIPPSRVSISACLC